MKFFEEPKMEVKAFTTEDIITASSGEQGPEIGEDDTPDIV